MRINEQISQKKSAMSKISTDTNQMIKNLMYGLCVGLHLAHVLPLVLHLDAVHGQVVPRQAEPLVLPNDELPSTDNPVVLFPD